MFNGKKYIPLIQKVKYYVKKNMSVMFNVQKYSPLIQKVKYYVLGG